MRLRDPLSWLSIKYKLTLTFVGICLIGFGVGGYIISESSRSALEKEITLRLKAQSFEISNSLNHTLDLLAKRTEDFASDGFIRTKLEEILSSYTTTTVDRSRLYRELDEHVRKNKLPLVTQFQDVMIFDVSGRKLTGTRNDSLPRSSSFFASVFASDSLCFSEIVTGENFEFFPALIVSTPVWDLTRARKIGYLLSCVNIGRWILSSNVRYSLEQQDNENNPDHFLLLDQSGKGIDVLLAGAVRNTQEKFYRPLNKQIRLRVLHQSLLPTSQDLKLAGRRMTSDGRDIIGYSFGIPRNGWMVAIDIDAAKAMLPVTSIQSRFLGVAIIIAFVTVVILFFPIRFLIRPLTNMRDAAKKIREGDFNARVQFDSSDEIGDLARSFNLMTEAVQERTNKLEHTATLLEKRSTELRLERDLLNAVVHSMKDGLIYLDRFGNIVLYNDAGAPLVKLMKSNEAEFAAKLCSKDSKYGRECLRCLSNPQEPTTSCIVDFGETVFEILATRLDSKEGMQGRILVSRDVTDRMRIDERQAHQERLAVLGEVSAMMAHELNNPLAAISMFNQMMEQEFPKDSPYHEHIEVIRRNADICKRTIRGLLDYSSATTPEISEFDLHELLSEVVRFLKPIYHKSNVAFELHFALGDALLESDEVYLRQVFVNLTLNAIQAMDAQGGKIVIETREDGEEHRIIIDIVDTGPGVPMEFQGKIFTPFFTSRKTGKGTGLGLPTSRRIIESFGGTLRMIESRKGFTLFRVELPRKMRSGVWINIPEEISDARAQ